MFEFAISQHQRHPPSRRFLASWLLSCLGHTALLLILLEYPQLLRAGMYHWFRQAIETDAAAAKNERWRNVAYLGSKMAMPPPEVLKKYVYDWNREKSGGGGTPPIRVDLPRVDASLPPAPVPPQPKPVAEPDAATVKPSVTLAGAPTAGGTVAAGDGKTAAAAPPPPDAAPKQIPKGVSDPPQSGSLAASSTGAGAGSSSQARSVTEPKPPEPQRPSVSVAGSALFDTKGFPLEEYANLIKERIKGNWFIPSNLRNSQGSTTVIFYINRDGQSIDVRIDVSSGNSSLDIAALSAVVGSNPFPPLPRGFPSDRVGARFVFAYNERQ